MSGNVPLNICNLMTYYQHSDSENWGPSALGLTDLLLERVVHGNAGGVGGLGRWFVDVSPRKRQELMLRE